MEKLSVKKPFTVLVAVIAVIALGVVSLTNMDTDLLPQLSLPYLMVLTTYPGASPERVESELTVPMEQALGTVKNVTSVSSVSAENYGLVQLSLAADTDMDSAMVNVTSAVNRVAAGLPEGAGTPSVIELSMDMLATLYIAVGRDDYDIYELSEYVDQEIIPYFQRLDGVASVTAVGLVERSVLVELNGEKIAELNGRILERANGALAQARERLDAARAEVQAGLDALETQERRFGETLASTLFAQLNAPSEELSARLRSTLGELSGALDALDGAMDGVMDGIEMPELDGTGLSEIVSELEAAAAALSPEADTLEETLEDARLLLETLRTIADTQEAAPGVSDLRTALERAERARSAAAAALLRGDLETMRRELETFRAAAEEASRTVRDMTGALRESAAELPALRQRLDWLRADFRQIANELSAGGGAATAFSHLSNAYGRIVALSTELWTLLDQLDGLEAGAQLSDQTAGLRDLLTALGERSEELPALLGTLETLLAQLTQGQLDAALAFGEASRQLAQAQSQLQSAEAQYEQARAKALEGANMDALVNAATLSKLIYAQNFSMPAGYVADEQGHSWLLRVGEEYESREDIAGALLADIDGVGPVRLTDIADITLIDNALDSYARLNGEGGIMLCIYKGSTAGTNAVSRSCQQAMEELQQRDGALRLVRLVDQGKYITIIINSILNSMLLGALLAVLVLALFLRDLRPTFVVALSIPLSVLFALVLMYFTGLSLNMMTLSGLALGIGMLVDNSIVVLENIVRLRARGLAAPRAAVQGTKQVAGAILASTLTTVSVFFPIVFTSGTVRDMLLPLSLAVSYCLVASLLVAMTLIPASTSTLLRRVQPRPNRLMERVQRRYGLWLRWCLKHKALPLLGSVALLVLALLRLLSIGIVILPDFTGDSVNVSITVPEDMERSEAYRRADQVMERLLELEGIDSVGIMDSSSVVSSVGITTGGGGSFGSFVCYATVPEGTSSGTLRRLCREAEERCADLDCTVTAQTSQMMDFTSFSASGLSVAVSGGDLERLADIAAQVADVIRGVEGFGAVSDGSEDAGDTLRLRIDKDKAMEYGLTVAQIYAEIATRLQTSVRSTAITADGLDMTVTVSDETDMLTREKLLELEFTPASLGGEALGEDYAFSQGGEGETGTEQTAPHRLGEFARLEETKSPSTIRRSDLSREITVSAETLPGYNTTVLSRALAPALEELAANLPHGYSIHVGGESEQVNDMISQMALLALLGLLLIYLIMVAQFQSLLSPFIILFTVPLAFTGGMLALILAGRQLTMLDIMGFLILMGTVVNNGIVFVDYANRLRLGGLEKREALVVTGQTRMRPILMTTLTTILAMAMLIFGDDMGSELGGGMAIVITGGLLYATLMTLFIIPILYDILYRRQPHVVDVGEDLDEEQDDAAEYLAGRQQES